nr:hypothetical protein [Tanacetum cinerariifolium]
MTWRQFILASGLHTEQDMVEAGFGAYWARIDRLISDKGDLRDYWIEISSGRDCLGPNPFNVLIRDPVRRLCHRMMAYSIHIRGRHLKRHAKGRKSRARLSGGNFIERLAMYFGLVAQGPERQQDAAAGALEVDEPGEAAEKRIERVEEEVHDLARCGRLARSFRELYHRAVYSLHLADLLHDTTHGRQWPD